MMDRAMAAIAVIIGLGIGALSLVARQADAANIGVTYDDFHLTFGLVGIVGAVSILLILLVSLKNRNE